MIWSHTRSLTSKSTHFPSFPLSLFSTISFFLYLFLPLSVYLYYSHLSLLLLFLYFSLSFSLSVIQSLCHSVSLSFSLFVIQSLFSPSAIHPLWHPVSLSSSISFLLRLSAFITNVICIQLSYFFSLRFLVKPFFYKFYFFQNENIVKHFIK